jgi:hypothetical protein
MRARSALAALAAERPASDVTTFTPLSESRAATADPISPGAMIATTYAMSYFLMDGGN